MRLLLPALVCCGCVGRPVVTVTDGQIEVEGETVIAVRDALEPDYLNIPALEEALRASKQSQPCAAISAPPQTRYALLKRLVFSCGAAGFHTVGFATNGPARVLPSTAGEGMLLLTPTELRQVVPGPPRLAVEDDVTLERLLSTLATLERAGLFPSVVPAL
jgi:hypothetical protein